MKRILEPESMDTTEEASAYDRILAIHTHWLVTPQVKAALQVIGRKEKLTALDIGTGTARIPIEIIKRAPDCKIYCLDTSSHMLKVAAENIKNAGLVDNVILLQANGKILPFKDKSFDMVICASVMHHVRDPVILLNEIQRLIKDNGMILIRDLIRPPSKLILNLYVGIVTLPYNTMMKKECRDSYCAAFTIKEYREIMNRSDMKGARISVSLPSFVTIRSGR